MKNDIDIQAEMKEKILVSAEKRFRYYGFKKTTMAEIAGDCDMSAANLYRFFTNKADIATVLVLNHFDESFGALKKIVQDKNIKADEKLKTYMLAHLEINTSHFSESPKISELIDYISMERHDLVEEKLNRMDAQVAEIIRQGNDEGIFAVPDPAASAVAVRVAFAAASFPPFVLALMSSNRCCGLEGLKELVSAIGDLIIRGLAKRP